MEEPRYLEQEPLIHELRLGLEYAEELHHHLDLSSPAGLLVIKILSSFTNALSMLESSCQEVEWSGQEVEKPLIDPMASSISTLSINRSVQSEESDQASYSKEHRDTFKKRPNTLAKRLVHVACSEMEDDGYTWRKYGQKDILGHKFPRSYYQCLHRNTKGCAATKQVQRSTEDDSIFDIIYRGDHICTHPLSPLPVLREQEPFADSIFDIKYQPETPRPLPPLPVLREQEQQQQQQEQTPLNFPMEPEVSYDMQIPGKELSLSCVPSASVNTSNPKKSIILPSKQDDHFMDEENEGASSLFDRKLSGPAVLLKPSTMFSKEISPPPDIMHGFFEYIHRISVLDLSHTKIEFLPKSISNLKKLQKLLLQHCEKLKMVPSLAMLKELRVLDLSHTIITELPQGMDELVNLRLLDLSFTRNLQTYTGGVLEKLSLLEDFLMFDSKCSWQSNSSDVLGGADIKEIISATHLVNLAIRFLDLPSFIGYVRSGHWRILKSYRFDIGRLSNCQPLASFRWKYSVQILGCDLVDEKDSLILPNNTLELVIKNCHNVSCLSEMHWLSHLSDLKECSVMDCDGMECILMGEKNTFPTIEEVIVYNLPQLRTLYRGVPQFGALASLKSVTIEHCHNLKNLFVFGLFQHLQNLEYVRLWMCDQVEEIVAEDEGMADGDHSNTITLPRLKELWLGFLRELRSICKTVVVCDSLVTIVVQNCLKLKKLPLSIGDVPCPLEKIKGSRKWWDALEWDDLHVQSSLQTLLIEQSDLESESEFGSESEEEEPGHDDDDDDEEEEEDDDGDEGGRRKRR